MHDLIPFATRQLGSASVNTVNARDLYDYLGINKPYAHWIKTQLNRAHLTENEDYVVFALEGKNPQGGRPQVDHHLTFDAAKHVAMMSSAEKGHEVRAWFIAKEKELAGMHISHPKLRDPAMQVLLDVVVQLDEARALATEARQVALVAETKADLALADAHRMTLEEFVMKNGLLRQFPAAQFKGYTAWLKTFCQTYGLSIIPAPVYGKSWDHENAYPLAALAAWLRHEQTRPCQVSLVRTP